MLAVVKNPGQSKNSRLSPLQIALGISAAVVLLTAHELNKRLREERLRLVSELAEVTVDLKAHKEALKISRQQCNAQIKRYRAAEEKTEALLNYYREGDHSTQKDWCKKLNEGALAEYKKAAQKHLKDVKDEMERVIKERNELSDRLQPLALCCKSAYTKASALMTGATKDEALRRSSVATRASARAIEEPHSVLEHTSRVEWSNTRYGDRTRAVPVLKSDGVGGTRRANLGTQRPGKPTGEAHHSDTVVEQAGHATGKGLDNEDEELLAKEFAPSK